MADAALVAGVTASFRRTRLIALAVPVAIFAYLVYAFVAFDVANLAQRARWDNAQILLSDFWSHKTHVTHDNRSGRVTVAIEGEAKGTYPPDRLPDWVSALGEVSYSPILGQISG